MYGPTELALIKTWFGHDDTVTYPVFSPCTDCEFYDKCKSIWDDCGKSDCTGCDEADECDGNMDCRKTGGEWDVASRVEWAWDGLREALTKENVMEVYFKSLRDESYEYGTFIDLSDADAVQSYAEDFPDYPHKPLPLFYDFFESILDYTAEVDEIVCLEYVKGTEYPEALVKAIPGDIGQALSKIGFSGEGYVMVLHSDYETEWGGDPSEVSYFNCIFYTDLRKRIDGIQDFHGYLDGNTYAFVVEDTFSEEIPEEVLEFMRKYNPNYPNRP